jgi:predicted dehydrogenase
MRHASTPINRRRFLRHTSAATGALALAFPLLHPRAAVGQGVREGIRVGVIGVGNQGKPLMLQNVRNVVAVCDVDSERAAAAKKAAEDKLREWGIARSVASCSDFRKLLENPEVDAVIIATPDHWHALQTVYACQAGKHVYVEKPLSLVVAEGRTMVQAARKHNRIVQTGSMQRSDPKFRLGCELVRSGRLGKIHTVRVGLPAVNYNATAAPDSAPPPELDYDLWLGPAPQRPYNKNHVHYNFRFFWDYSGGQMTNWGAHHLDIAQWGLGMDASGPVEVEGSAEFDPEGRYEVFREAEIVYRYADGVKMICSQGPGRKMGTLFEGEKGSIYLDRGILEANPGEIATQPLGPGDVHLYASANHHDNWYECIKNGQRPICDVEIGHRSATVCHLGNLACRTGRKLTWDPVRETLVGDPETTKRLNYTYRAPWVLPPS